METRPSACSRHEDDLALLAGGDLPSGAVAAELELHVAACAPCRALLEGLKADQRAFSSAAAAPAPVSSVAAHVLADLTAAPAATRFPSAAAPLVPLRRWMGGAAAAAVLLAGVAGLLALDRLAPAEGDAVVRAADPEFVPVEVRRTSSDAVELSWRADGRTDAYHVLASDSPGDFTRARKVDVAGSHLVATMDLPERRLGDRKVTYFRVQ